MPTLVLRQVLKDRRTLADILAGLRPDMDQLRRRALAGEWERSSGIPDHILRNRGDAGLKDAGTEWALLRAVLGAYADEYLYRRGGRVHVHFDKFGSWQAELADLSPLPFLAYGLWRWHGAPDLARPKEIRDYMAAHLGTLRNTLLITPHHPLVEDIITGQGLHDRHIHLNGSTEVDKVWQDQLANVAGAAREIRAQMPRLSRVGQTDVNKSMLAEFYEQLSLKPEEVGHCLRIARRLRMVLADFALDGAVGFSCEQLTRRWALPELDLRRRTSEHPLMGRFPGSTGNLASELLLLILVFRRLEAMSGKSVIGHLLHLYLLILNCISVPLTIQGERQKGFDQFQKFTFTGMRNPSEGRAYVDRFRQLNHEPGQDLAVLEGRFAPSDDLDKMKRLVLNILNGLAKYRRRKRPFFSLSEARDLEPSPVAGEPRMELYLVAHFIKEADRDPNPPRHEKPKSLLPPCRHHELRHKLMRRWRVIRHLRESYPVAKRFIVGIDAAANEQHARPEVFAPLYRAARRAGIVNFTYHAGEDFDHLVSGIRAVAEAVRFLNLRGGARIGHGTAIGIDPSLWRERVPKGIRMSQGDHLDDLVFAHTRLTGCQGFEYLLPMLEKKIHDLSSRIYGRGLSPAMLSAAWELRGLDPLAIPQLEAGGMPVDPDRQRELLRLRKAHRAHPGAFELFLLHHSPAVRRLSAVSENVDGHWLPIDALRRLQVCELEELAKRQVALETLPTSNVRISFYRNHAEHHVFRWLSEPPDVAPMVCVGSDDPGIFANSMRGEYYHLARELRQTGKNWNEVSQTLHFLNDNSRIYGFRS